MMRGQVDEVDRLKELLQDYKGMRPQQGFVSELYTEHPVYWLLLKMCQFGQPESLAAIARQIAVSEDSLRTVVDTLSLAPRASFPLKIKTDVVSKQSLVAIEPDMVTHLRKAAMQVSPEHMPIQVIKVDAANKGRIERNVEYYFHAFSRAVIELPQQPSSDLLSRYYSYPVHEVVSILSATNGLDDYHIEAPSGRAKYIQIYTPNIMIALMPAVCSADTGFCTERLAILDFRDEVQRMYSAAYPEEKVLPIVLSIGFTHDARQACISNPKVLLMELWAFLRLVGQLQAMRPADVGTNTISVALTRMKQWLTEPIGRGFEADGFADRIIRSWRSTREAPC